MTSELIIDVNEANFEYEVISYSQNLPVIVDFWANWCRPCKTLSPLLEKLVYETQGAFRLAKVDVDNNPNLTMRFGVRSIPTVKAITQGEVVAEFVGEQPENRLREFIKKIMPPSQNSLAQEKAESFLYLQDWSQAESTFRSVLEKENTNPGAILGLIKSLIPQGKIQEAYKLLIGFPASRQLVQAELVLPLCSSMLDLQDGNLNGDLELDAMFKNAIRLVNLGNLEAAVDGLLEILRNDKHYNDDIARKVVLSILEIMHEDKPETRAYRAELASVLF
ncbi:MAG: thioredoxin [Anaerolineaceae bacterium]|nr:thioredoxin [Anaerolineaceae bacterium]